MTKHSVLTALLFGIGFIALAVLLLNIPIVNLVPMMWLIPGGLATAPFTTGEGWTYAIAILVANALMYSGLAFLFVRRVDEASLRWARARLSVLVLMFASLACVPRLNPLWPHSLNALTNREMELQKAISLGMTLPQARAILNSKGIRFQEEAQESSRNVLSTHDTVITASSGDRVLFSRLRTEAYQFPCGYDMQIVLLFGGDDKLKDRYIHRLRICP